MLKKQFSLRVLMMACMFVTSGTLLAADDQVQVIGDSQLGQWWQDPPGHPNVAPKLPLAVAQAGVEGCVAVAFEVRGDGGVSNERIWKSTLTTSDVTKPFEQIILRGVHAWHFVPATSNVARVPVYTFRAITYAAYLIPISPTGAAQALTQTQREQADQSERAAKARCEIADFPQQVQAMIGANLKARGGQR